MTKEEIRKIIEDHELWLRTSGTEGKKAKFSGLDLSFVDLSLENLKSADFSAVNLCGANLTGANLHGADLRGAVLNGADLCGAVLRGADLYGADLIAADLRGADFRTADLCGADFREARLRGADFGGADLRFACLHEVDLRKVNLIAADLREANLTRANLIAVDLIRADLRDADLRGADLRDAELREACISDDQFNQMFPLQCPETGSFVGWKKTIDKSGGEYIVKLLIPEDAKRSSSIGRKCRCSKAKTLSIQELDGTDSGVEEVMSHYNHEFIYRVGEYAEVTDFDEDRKNECSTGIHFFITRNEAVNYDFR